ncbi:MAG: hypothetical protein ACYSU0_00545 [Planctomycetota bacterium]|jgi:hypothetical protein
MRTTRIARTLLTVALAGAACLLPRGQARAQEDEGAGEAILEARITLSLERATVRKVVEAIAEKTGMQYMAVDEALDMESTVTFRITARPVAEVLEFLEERLGLDLDFGHLEETGVLIVAPREPEEDEDEGEGEGEEEEEEQQEFDPQLEHAEALRMIRSLPAVSRLIEKKPGVEIDLEWDADERRWEADLRLGDDEIGRVELGEFEDERPRITKVEIHHDLPGPAPQPGDNF